MGVLMSEVAKVLGVLVLAVIAIGIVYFAVNYTGAINKTTTSTIFCVTCNQNNTQLQDYVPCTNGIVCYVNQRISNFALLKIDAANGTISGYEWIMYPVSMARPVYVTLRVGNSVGSGCDGTLATLESISSTYALFELNTTKSGMCPV